MPPALQLLWVQAVLIGVTVSIIGIRNRIHPVASAGLSALAIALIFVANATICGMITLDSNPNFANLAQRGLKGFAGSLHILLPLVPYFMIAPITSLVTSGVYTLTSKRSLDPRASFTQFGQARFSISTLMLLTMVLGIACWQLAMFVRYDAF